MVLDVKIPIKAHLKKYLIKRYDSGDEMTLSKDSVIGKIIIKNFSERNNISKKLSLFDEQINIKFDHRYDLTFSHGNIYDFNMLIEDLYRKELMFFMQLDNFFNPKPERKKAILSFNQFFAISESDIKLETLIKYVQRHPQDMKLIDNYI